MVCYAFCAAVLVLRSAPSSAFEPDFYLNLAAGWAGHSRFSSSDLDALHVSDHPGFTATVRALRNFSSDDDDATWRVGGGVWLHEHLGFELAYVDLGSTEQRGESRTVQTNELDFTSPFVLFAPARGPVIRQTSRMDAADLRGISLLAKTRFPFSRRIDVNVNLGAIRWDLDGYARRFESNSAPIFGTTRFATREALDKNAVDVTFGAGLKWHATSSVDIGIEWNRYEVGSFDEHVDTVTVNAEYHFGGNAGEGAVRARQMANKATVLSAARKLWATGANEPVLLAGWEYFVSIAGGLAEHNSRGSDDDEFFTASQQINSSGFPFFPPSTDSTEIGFKVDDDATAWRILAGAYVNRYFGFELGYVDLGTTQSQTYSFTRRVQPGGGFSSTVFPGGITTTAETSSAKTDLSGFVFGGRFRLPLTDRLEFGVSLGGIVWDGDEDTHVLTVGSTTQPNLRLPPSANDSIKVHADTGGVDLSYSVGIKGRVYRDMWVGLEYARYETGHFDQDAAFFNLQLEYRFGTGYSR